MSAKNDYRHKKLRASRDKWRARAKAAEIRLETVRQATSDFETVWYTPTGDYVTIVAVGEFLETLDGLHKQEN